MLLDYLQKVKKEYKNLNKQKIHEQDKACYQYDMTYGDFKDLRWRTASDRMLCDKAFGIAKNPKYYRHQRGLASMGYKLFDKKNI